MSTLVHPSRTRAMRRRSRPIEVLCASCDRFGRHGGRRLCKTCYKTHHMAGTLDRYPPLGCALPRLWRTESYAELRDGGVPIREAAQRLGVHERTAQRYEARLKAAAQDSRSEAA